jgi:hypothetical protein
MNMKMLINKIQNNPAIFFKGVMIFLAISLVMMVLVDAFNIFGIKYFMVERLRVPYFWFHWWGELIFDPIQFYLLGLTIVFFGVCAGLSYERQNREFFFFWFLVGIGLVFMIIEDTSDMKGTVRGLAEGVAGERKYGFWGTITEFFYYSTIGVIMLFPVIKYRKIFDEFYDVKKYFIIGYASYALSQISSFAGSAFGEALEYKDLYQRIGEFFISFFIKDEITQTAYNMSKEAYAWIDFYLIDRVWEESLELMGMAALITAAFYFFVKYRDQRKIKSV